jgi:hypothetical protein
LDSGNPPQLNVAKLVGTLSMDDRDVRVHGPNSCDALSGKWTLNGSQGGRVCHQIGIGTATKNPKRQPRSPSHKCSGETGMRMFFNLEWTRPVLLHGIPEPMQQSETGVPGPGKNEFFGAAHADHLIEDNVGAKPDEGQIAALLPDDFVSCRKWDEVTKAFKRDGIAIVDKFLDGLF